MSLFDNHLTLKFMILQEIKSCLTCFEYDEEDMVILTHNRMGLTCVGKT